MRQNVAVMADVVGVDFVCVKMPAFAGNPSNLCELGQREGWTVSHASLNVWTIIASWFVVQAMLE